MGTAAFSTSVTEAVTELASAPEPPLVVLAALDTEDELELLLEEEEELEEESLTDSLALSCGAGAAFATRAKRAASKIVDRIVADFDWYC